MTLGKFLIFCKSSGVFGSEMKMMTKEMLTNGFRRVAEGKQEIHFEVFEALVK